MTTANGRTAVAQLTAVVAFALGPANVAATDGCRLGGGPYGELRTPGTDPATTVQKCVDWMAWLVEQYKGAGFARRLFMLLPGFGARTRSGGYRSK